MSAPVVPVWTNQALVLYHGTTRPQAESIVRSGVDLRYGSPKADFGRGFYTTTSLRQAQRFAARKQRQRDTPRAVVEFSVGRMSIAEMSVLGFVLGTSEAADFWSFVQFCRGESVGHRLAAGSFDYYDVVFGPVAKNWDTLELWTGLDQVSFHTSAAIALLNQHGNGRIIEP